MSNGDTIDEAFPAFLVIISMPLTSSISTGIALGFISYPILKIFKGKWREVHPLVYIFAVLFFYQLAFFTALMKRLKKLAHKSASFFNFE